MRVTRSCLLAAAVLVVPVASLAAPSTAAAGDHAYCGAPNFVYPGYPCYSGEAHTYDYNRVTYSGSGNFQFCEELYYGSTVYSIKCRSTPGFAEGWSDDEARAAYPNTNTFMHDIIINNDNNRHTLDGYSSW